MHSSVYKNPVAFHKIHADSLIIPQKQYNSNLATPLILLYNRDNNHRLSQEVSMRRVFSFFIGTTIGGMIGATMALLFTPSSGAEMRAQITDRSQVFANEIRQAADTKRIELQERLEILRAPKA
jgi:hypothetical protein